MAVWLRAGKWGFRRGQRQEALVAKPVIALAIPSSAAAMGARPAVAFHPAVVVLRLLMALVTALLHKPAVPVRARSEDRPALLMGAMVGTVVRGAHRRQILQQQDRAVAAQGQTVTPTAVPVEITAVVVPVHAAVLMVATVAGLLS
jgi:hypothetical protein